MLRNLVCSLFLVEPKEGMPRRVTTTLPKAKEARRLAERAITLGKKGTLHARRQALALLANKGVVKSLFADLAPFYTDRNGGYTRIVRLAKCRIGDGADLCYFELVSEAAMAGQKPAEPMAPKVAPQPESAAKEPAAAETSKNSSAETPAEAQGKNQNAPDEQQADAGQ